MGGGIASLRAELEAKDLAARAGANHSGGIAPWQESETAEEERERALTTFEAQHAFDTETSEGLANAYAIAETTWTLEAGAHVRGQARKVTREQIRDSARKYLSRTDYAQVALVPKKAAP